MNTISIEYIVSEKKNKTEFTKLIVMKNMKRLVHNADASFCLGRKGEREICI